MEPQDQPEQNTGGVPPQPEKKTPEEPKRDLSIRTMKSDVAGYMTKEKPSIVNMIAREEDEQGTIVREARPPTNILSYVASGIMVVIFLFLVYAGYLYYQSQKIAANPEQYSGAAVKFFETDKTGTYTIKQDRAELLKILKAEASERERDGSVKGLSLTLENAISPRPMTPHEFFAVMDIPTRSGVLNDMDLQFQPFIFYTGGQGYFGMAARTKNPDKTLASLLGWESSIQKDLDPLFFGKAQEVTIPLFEDKSYKNITYRYVQLSLSQDFGIGYFIHRGKSVAVIGFSEEELKVIISRLLES